MDDISHFLLLFLFGAAILAGFVDAIAGGGGLINLPALLIAGAPPISALATNKLAGIFGVATAVLTYARKGQVNLKKQWPMAVLSALGAFIGAMCATLLPEQIFQIILPFILVAIAIYFAMKPNLNDKDQTQRITPLIFAISAVPLIGFYDGIFGPGTGSFFMLAFVSLAGFGLLKATAHTKLLNFASNVGAFVFFAFSGGVLWKIGLLMALGQMIGAELGARFAIRKGAKLIKPLLIIVCVALAFKLVADREHPIWQFMARL